MIAPEGSIVNAVSPQPCTARHVVGMFLPNALLKALAQVRPDAAMAEGSGAVWTMQVSGNHDDGSPFITAMFTYAGGVGARATKSGLDACSTRPASRPSRSRSSRRRHRSASAQGAAARLRRRRRPDRRARPDDRVRGRHDPPVAAQRRHQPAGQPARASSAAGRAPPVGSSSTAPTSRTQARITLQPDDVVRLELPGGGGYGEAPDAVMSMRPGPPGRHRAGRRGAARHGAGPGPRGRPSRSTRWRRAVADGPERCSSGSRAGRRRSTEWTYGEFDRVVEGAAVRLEAAGVGPGDAVHLALTNSPTFVAVWLAAIRARRVDRAVRPDVDHRRAHRAHRPHEAGRRVLRDRAGRHLPGRPEPAAPPTVIAVDEADTDLPWLARRRRPPSAARPSARDRPR